MKPSEQLSPFRIKDKKPDEGQLVIWIWAAAGQVSAGDISHGKIRDASRNYAEVSDNLPTHWMPFPEIPGFAANA